MGYFYDPNIHPYSEYKLRLLDVKRSCKMLNIELLEGDYDVDNWLKAVRGFENEPEKGERCAICFDRRFEVTAQQAAKMGEKTFTSTLLTSPKKSLEQLKISGDNLAKQFGIKFLAPDYRKASGTQEQNILAKADALYRQNYCGCLYALNIQRDSQERLADELFSPLSQQIQPESIEARIELYEKRWNLEDEHKAYKIVKERFLNWRQMHGLLRIKKQTIPAHFLPLSTLKSEYTRGKIDVQVGDLYYMNRDEVKFITLETYNNYAKTNYVSVEALIFSSPTFEEELKIRHKLISNPYDLSAILVVEKIPNSKLEIIYKSHIYEDVKEVLLEIS
ncbi:MAG: FIG053235: Diacylglucosamine hydrolase like [uncultured Sulfurovum sp.]|uniref:Epoxyqueuosine reductase QueH n=1 Tax=uncultured Sulfurovum sp. TaxID=269237 RepID=A0A6S6S4W0_9BACT|nr:MAG: FIG053235: Diacylglucosamine hydrolase like [uncultured Sulfurovum sp.]